VSNTSGRCRAVLVSAALAAAAPAAGAQDELEDLEQIVVTGTRVPDRSATETAVPVDIVTAESLANVGVSETEPGAVHRSALLQLPRPGLADGTDTIRPATLRGLAPDQTLVLLNSKRRHASSLVNVNAPSARLGGSRPEHHPTAAVNSVEVLRDGASAQYGSDAIAGVINVLLRDDADGGDLTALYGRRESSYEVPTGTPPAGATWSAPSRIERDVSDGDTVDGARLEGHGARRDRLPHHGRRVQGPGPPPNAAAGMPGSSTTGGRAFDPREQTFDRFNAWYGEPELEQVSLFAKRATTSRTAARVRLGGLPGPRGPLRGLLPPCAGRPERHRDPSGRLPADHCARGHRLQPGGWRRVELGRLADGCLAGLRVQRDGVRGRALLNRSLRARADTVRRGRIRLRPVGIQPRRRRSTSRGGSIRRSTSPRASRRAAKATRSRPANRTLAQRRRAAAERPAHRVGRSGVPRLPPRERRGREPHRGRRLHRPRGERDERLLASAALRTENYSDFGSNLSGKLAGRFDFTGRSACAARCRTDSGRPRCSSSTRHDLHELHQRRAFDIATFPVNDPVAKRSARSRWTPSNR